MVVYLVFIQTLNVPLRKTKSVPVLTLHVRFFSAKPARDTKLMHLPQTLTRQSTRFTALTRLLTAFRNVSSDATHPLHPNFTNNVTPKPQIKRP